ncbi:kelch domain-containing protein 4 [Trichonephila inaurata madagascariensis]|uniref:Kelch domain-containing protein 4 n=1 Tax=Trichonephila inaurata madagascariensis TaxID=2747483 RepID=A0A8X7CEK7_9ARAC|nr:kelch domain-containing protein 4 [Trichonephila inaurata madagascariensis]
MGKKDKKKGKGAEKTALKTERKTLNRLKKELASKGEDDIEKLISDYQEKHKTDVVGEELCPQPSPRSGFSLCHHPDKDELVLFGGEYYNGKVTTMFNDIHFYNIKKGQWSILHTPVKPPPRCAHQAVVLSQKGGQLWIFGGEFIGPSRSVFYHYKDLWVFHFAEKRWEEIKAPGAPPSRSGHRMVARRKQIVIFGGFRETVQDYKYYNDLYVFDLDTYTWNKIEAVGKIPSFRSGCLFAPLVDGRMLLYGGYTKEKVKKDVDKGISHTDMYYLQVDEKSVPHKWKWNQVKPSGIPPSIRCGISMAVAPNNLAYCFGGVYDDDVDEEDLNSLFHNDLYVLEMEKGRWLPVTLHGKSSRTTRKKRRKVRDDDMEEDYDESEKVAESLEKAKLGDDSNKVVTKTDDVFTVKIGPSTSATPESSACALSSTSEAFSPKGRMGAGMAVKSGILYLYGGIFEDDERQVTLSDFYALDTHKLDEWRTIVPFSTSNLEWFESESEDSSSESDDSSGDDDGMESE